MIHELFSWAFFKALDYLWFAIIFAEIIINTISRLGIVHRELKLPQLWSEAAIIKALIYKHGNTHKKQKYFQGLKRVR